MDLDGSRERLAISEDQDIAAIMMLVLEEARTRRMGYAMYGGAFDFESLIQCLC